jgi:hypothetical protein
VFDTAVDLALAAFCAEPDASDDAILERLEREGIEPWLAEQLVRWVPIAFARWMLARLKVVVAPTYTVGERRYELCDEPVYVAAKARAARASRAELEATQRRSPEFDAVNNALLAAGPDARAAGAVVALSFDSKLSLGDGDGGAPSVRRLFAQLVEAHQINVIHGVEASDLARSNPREWLDRGLDQALPLVGELIFDAWIYPKQGRFRWLQADFIVWHPRLAAPRLIESYTGAGETWRDAIVDAVTKFAQGSLHTLIAALIARGECASHTHWEPLEEESPRFDLCVNPPIGLYAPTRAPDFRALLRAVRSELAKRSLSREVHWLRLSAYGSNGAIDEVEALLDNERWTEGEAIVADAGWELVEPLWGWRWFMVLVPR